MNGKIISFILMIVVLLGTYAYAQDWPSTASIVDKVRTGLSLNDEQFGQVKLIIEDNMAKRRKIVQASDHRIITLSQSQDMDTELYTKLSEVLTEQQMNKWNKILDLIVQDMDSTGVIQGDKNE
jgi:hypothetical protein